MNKEFVTYEQARALKELGFDEPCFGYYVDGELRGINLGIEELGGIEPYYQRFGFHTLSNHNIDNPNKIVVTAPLYQQAFRWFIEKHGLLHDITLTLNINDELESFYILIHKLNGLVMNEDDDIELNVKTTNKEEAESACLDKLIEITNAEIKNRG